MAQSKLESFNESVVSTIVGLILSLTVAEIYYIMNDINISLMENIYLSAIMTVVSFLRSYVVRRFFNKIEK